MKQDIISSGNYGWVIHQVNTNVLLGHFYSSHNGNALQTGTFHLMRLGVGAN